MPVKVDWKPMSLPVIVKCYSMALSNVSWRAEESERQIAVSEYQIAVSAVTKKADPTINIL